MCGRKSRKNRHSSESIDKSTNGDTTGAAILYHRPGFERQPDLGWFGGKSDLRCCSTEDSDSALDHPTKLIQVNVD
jgi:hypothetical protein